MSYPKPHDRINVIEYLLGKVPKSSPEVPVHVLCHTAFDDGFKAAMDLARDYIAPISMRDLGVSIITKEHPYDVFK